MSDTLTFALIFVPCLIVAIVFHEVAHGWAAKALGDPTASERGRLTLNPIRHVDPIGTLLVPGGLLLMGAPAFGWAKPVPVNKWRLSNPRFGMMAVAAAGPLSNFVLALVGAVLFGLALVPGADWGANSASLPMLVDPQGTALPIATGLYLFIMINVFLGFFNLLPIPPFDGSHIVGGLLPARLRSYWERLQRFGMVLIIGVIGFSWVFGTGWLEVTVLPLVAEVMGFYDGIAIAIAQG
ncbi:site-2 protease family protein [Erythrobacter sp. SCSIO 43205]|uniref:site-2 protease family protein n=1 Tax=Erythrobacter sp. SCSIO 43205 TaxID=2779361 RepID=UPI001CA93F8B|nr:site-2 protease family protein [Erythrobacter sp. SCSIO 43205]UAB77887.1 site-2 protease family protein [Erythrobacter sp. SCSIO 43205]